jgi:hypothetical protein
MAMTPAERKRRQREKNKQLDVQEYRMELTSAERHSIAKAASRQGYDDQTEYLLDLVYADLKKPASRACNYPECNCPFDKPAGAECYRGYEEQAA